MLFKKKLSAPGSESKNWYKDKYEFVRQQRDVLAAITMLSLLLSAGSVFTVMWLTPYKSVEPFVIQINEKSGMVQRVDPVQRTEFTANESIDRYFIVQYIRARESYLPSTFSLNYQTVRVMSDKRVFGQYAASMRQGNPASPINQIGNNGRREVKIKNINFVRRNASETRAGKTALVRLSRDTSIYQPAQRRTKHYVLTMDFRYVNMNLNEEERYLNPLGFIVEEYQLEEEVVQ